MSRSPIIDTASAFFGDEARILTAKQASRELLEAAIDRLVKEHGFTRQQAIVAMATATRMAVQEQADEAPLRFSIRRH